jgi:hypothetical protein
MKTILSSIRSFASNLTGSNFSGFTGPRQLPDDLGLRLIEPMG